MTLRSICFLALAAFMCRPRASARAEGELMVMPASLQVVPGHDYSVTVKNGRWPAVSEHRAAAVMNPGIEPERKCP